MPEPETKDPDRIRDMFDTVADRYDTLNRLLSFGLDRFWRDQVIRKLEGDVLLDIACGSGDVLQQAEAEINSGFGLDFSRSMLGEANDKLTSDDLFLVQGDALKLPFSNSVADVATCAFGVRNFPDRLTAFREIKRILKPSGQLMILEFFPPKQKWFNKPLLWYLSNVLPAIGRFVSQADDAYDYLNRSIQTFASPEDLGKELRECGFASVAQESVFLGLVRLITAREREVRDHA